ncbi:MAG: hypothetical protein HOK80_01345 [Candidatus Cloacimonetes bacterium]|nr:hypothetical protein [Candidatus Cloacimonadota bacterium]
MTDKATPTITLAELYENQDQYIDALVIYKNLNKENPTEELQNKINELKDIIFRENTLEYSTIIDKIFTEEEKRIFHILPHEQYKAYKESQADLKNDETYPEELTAIEEEDITPDEELKPETENETLEIEDPIEPEIEPEEKEIFEQENTVNKVDDIEELIIDEEDEPKTEAEIVPEINELETPEIEETTEPELKTDDDKEINIDEALETDDQLEDDISLEIDEEIQKELDVTVKQETKTEEAVSIEDIMKNNAEGQNGIIENEIETDPVDEMDTIRESQTDNHILELLTNLSKMRPDIVDRVLKENIGPEASLAEIKLSDLHYVVELLKVSENVERD